MLARCRWLTLAVLSSLAWMCLTSTLPAQVLKTRTLLEQETFWDNLDWDWYEAQIPFFECPDREIQTTYYYRWELLTKHLTYGSPNSGYSFTEFIDRPFWSGAYGAISCPAGHQLYEARWLRSPRVARDYGRYWLRTPGAQPRNYSTWLADSVWAVHDVHPDADYLIDLLPDLVKNYEGWEQRHFVPEVGLFWQTGHDDGMEFNINSRQTKDILRGAPSFRPSFNAYMWADAMAIARIADLAEEPALEKRFRDKAEALKNNVLKKLWDPKRQFFFPMYRDNEERDGHKIQAGTLTYQSGQFAGDSHGRELIGYVPWQFQMLDPGLGYEVAWKKLMDRNAFWADRGPTTVERHDPMFLLQKSCCWWSGQSWPYATTQTLKGMAHLLQEPSVPAVAATEADVRTAVDRSLAYLGKDGDTWISERGCMSCHHIPFLVWAHRSAEEHGLKIDDVKLAGWEKWCQQDSLSHRNQYRLQSYELGKLDKATLPDEVREKLKPAMELPFPSEADFVAKLATLLSDEELKTHQAALLKAAVRSQNHPDRTGGGLDVLASLLLGDGGPKTALAADGFLDSTAQVMQGNQLADGSWMSGQQHLTMRRWSEQTANQVSSMWAVLALAERAPGPKSDEAIARALAYLQQQPSVDNNREWLATRLLFEQKFGNKSETTRLSELLIKAQNPDGGWAWEVGGVSDPLTTGLAMYALAKVGTDQIPVFTAARIWLLSQQAADGSWPTASKNFTKTTDPERLAARDEIYHYWGTAWAALGLLETVGVVKDPEPVGSGLKPADYLEALRTFAVSHRKDGRPYLAEALHPDTGSFEGHDGYNHSEHYFHSGYCDLVITGLVGLIPQSENRLVLHPLAPSDWDYFALDRVKYQGHELCVLWDKTGQRYGKGAGLRVLVDGTELGSSPTLSRMEIQLPDAPASGPAANSVRTNFAVNNDGWYFPRYQTSYSNPRTPSSKLFDGNSWYHLHPPNRWTCEDSPNSSDWVVVDFGVAREFDEVQLYFLDDEGQTPIQAPRSVQLEAWGEGKWQPLTVNARIPEHPAGHRANRYQLSRVTASKVRVTLEHAEGKRSGLTEIEIWGDAKLPVEPVLMPSGNLAYNDGKQDFPKAGASHTSRYDQVRSANDGIVNFNPNPNNRWTSYESPNATDWLEIDFGKLAQFSRVELAIYDDRGGVQAPETIAVEAWDGSAWKPVAGAKLSVDKPVGGQFNEIRFPPLTASKVRFVFTHRGAARTGVSEVLIWPE